MVNFTKVEKQLLNLAIEKGVLSLQDFYLAYKSKEIIRQTIERFKFLQLIKEDTTKIENFIIDIEKIKETLK